MPERIDVEPGSPEWMAARRSGVTATDIVTICGLSSTDSAYALYYRKLGIIPEPGDSDRWRLGRDLDPIIRERWAQAQPGPWHFDGGALYRSDERPWQMATPDYRVGEGIDWRGPLTGVLELKSWADADRARWDDGPPPAVRAQVLWQMDVLGVATGHVGVLFLPSGEFRSHVIEHEQHPLVPGHHPAECTACQETEIMLLAGESFMRRLAENDPPSPDGSAATLAALKARFAGPRNDKTAVIDPALWDAYDDCCRGIAELKESKAIWEASIRELIGEAGIIEVAGEVVARRQRYTVKAHQRKASTVDKITRVRRKDDDDE